MKISYSFTAITPLFTGSDEPAGTIRTLRREKVLLATPLQIDSSFSNPVERRKALMDVIYPIYVNIPVQLKQSNYGFYDAYANKVKSCAGSRSKNQFLNRLLVACSIETLDFESAKTVKNALDKFSDEEFLEILKEEHSYLMILLREYVAIFRQEHFGTLLDEINALYPAQKNSQVAFRKSFENVPYFGGNSIRGYLRRLLMVDFCNLAKIEKLEKSIYHQLFTGGALTDTSEKIDIDFIEKYSAMCPPIALLGSAIGNTTVEGELKVIGARLHCSENGTGEISYWELVEILFATRLDDSKHNQNIKIEDYSSKDKKENPIQMLYQNEAFITGSVFDSAFILTTENSLIISTFWRMLKLWKENNIIGGNSARDYGVIDLHIDFPPDADAEYLNYITDKQDEIREYFNVEKKKK
jgi:hypothetical protein